MSVIRMTGATAERVKEHLFTNPGEHFGFLLAEANVGREGPIFLVKHFQPVSDDEVTISDTGWEIDTAALLRAINAAVRSGRALIEVHNHPYGRPRFSPTDRQGFKEFVPYVLSSLPERPYAATVWTKDGVYGEFFTQDGTSGSVRSIMATGQTLTQLTTVADLESSERRFVRQEAWFTREGQRRLAALRVAVVGLGGTGSQVAQSLVYLGARDFLLIEADAAEETNLNRLVTAAAFDLDTPKIILARRLIRAVAPAAQVRIVEERLPSRRGLEALKTADVVFGCVDNDGARLVLNELCLAYRIPLIDLAVGIDAPGASVEIAGGRVAVVIPGGPCLHCMGEIDTEEARYFLDEPANRELAFELGYVAGINEPAPAVVSLNAAVAASAVTEFAILISGLRETQPFTELDVLGTAYEVSGQRLSPRRVGKRDGCVQCMVLGRGDKARIERYALAATQWAGRPEEQRAMG